MRKDQVVGIAYRCDAELGCTFIVWDAEVTTEEWRKEEERMFADPAFPPGPRALADMRTAGGSRKISLEVVGDMARNLRARAPEIGQLRLAIVPNSGWEKAQRFEAELAGSDITSISFTNVVTACTWLGLDGDAARAVLDTIREEMRA